MPEYSYKSGKLHRSHLLHYLDSTFGGTGTPNWFVLGKDVEDASVELILPSNLTINKSRGIQDLKMIS